MEKNTFWHVKKKVTIGKNFLQFQHKSVKLTNYMVAVISDYITSIQKQRDKPLNGTVYTCMLQKRGGGGEQRICPKKPKSIVAYINYANVVNRQDSKVLLP